MTKRYCPRRPAAGRREGASRGDKQQRAALSRQEHAHRGAQGTDPSWRGPPRGASTLQSPSRPFKEGARPTRCQFPCTPFPKPLPRHPETTTATFPRVPGSACAYRALAPLPGSLVPCHRPSEKPGLDGPRGASASQPSSACPAGGWARPLLRNQRAAALLLGCRPSIRATALAQPGSLLSCSVPPRRGGVPASRQPFVRFLTPELPSSSRCFVLHAQQERPSLAARGFFQHRSLPAGKALLILASWHLLALRSQSQASPSTSSAPPGAVGEPAASLGSPA